MAPEIVRPGRVRNRFYHWGGLAILAANKVRHDVRGYRRPRPFPVTEIDQAVAYDLDVVRKLTAALDSYVGQRHAVRGRTVLELGPGADLGVGLLLLAQGASSYVALDVHELATQAPRELYEVLFQRLGTDAVTLRGELEKALGRQGSASSTWCARTSRSARSGEEASTWS